MIRLLSDENFDRRIVRGILRRAPYVDIIRVQDVGLRQADDPTVLEWAASQKRILLTHDRQTMPGFVDDRINRGNPTSGVFILNDQMPIGQAIEEILLFAECSTEEEWKNMVVYFPI